MNFELTEDQQAFVDTAKAFAEKELAPNAAKWDEEHALHAVISEHVCAAKTMDADTFARGDAQNAVHAVKFRDTKIFFVFFESPDTLRS